MEYGYLYPWMLISHLHFCLFPLNYSFKIFRNIHPVSFVLPSTISQNLLERKDLSAYLVSIRLLRCGWSFIFIVWGDEASYACSMLMMMNSSHYGWSWPLWLNLSNPLWVLGDVEFGMNAKESQVLFGVSCGILRPCQNLYIKGGRFVDAGVTWKS